MPATKIKKVEEAGFWVLYPDVSDDRMHVFRCVDVVVANAVIEHARDDNRKHGYNNVDYKIAKTLAELPASERTRCSKLKKLTNAVFVRMLGKEGQPVHGAFGYAFDTDEDDD